MIVLTPKVKLKPRLATAIKELFKINTRKNEAIIFIKQKAQSIRYDTALVIHIIIHLYLMYYLIITWSSSSPMQ